MPQAQVSYNVPIEKKIRTKTSSLFMHKQIQKSTRFKNCFKDLVHITSLHLKELNNDLLQ